MRRIGMLLIAMLVTTLGCATQRPGTGLAMPADDEAGAASLLGTYMLARGWTVRLVSPTRVQASLAGEVLTLEPLLDPAGLDRIIVSRTWAGDASADAHTLEAFAAELNEALNVGQFHATVDGLVLLTSLPFLDSVDPHLFEAFLEFTAAVRLAVLRVQGERTLLATVESRAVSR